MALFSNVSKMEAKEDTEIDKSVIDSHALHKKINNNDQGIVFFTGAGFSKSWNSNYPLGTELFSISDIDKLKNEYNFFRVAEDLDIKEPLELNSDKKQYVIDCYQYFQDIKFHLDTYKRYPSLLPNFLDPTLIVALENEMRKFITERFSSMVGSEELDLIVKKDKDHPFVDFFDNLIKNNKKISFVSTNYDLVIEKIIENIGADITLNRGVIDTEKFRSLSWHENKINLYKINGGFDVEQKGVDLFNINHVDKPAFPHIILPSKEQNYCDSYFDSVFIKSANKLREADILIFIGYSLPIEDHTIQFLLKNFKDSNNSNKEIIIIAHEKSAALKIKSKAVHLFPAISEADGIFAYDGGFDGFVKDVLSY